MFFGRSDHCHQWFYDGFLMLLPSLSMVFDGSRPLVKRCDGFDGSLWSTFRGDPLDSCRVELDTRVVEGWQVDVRDGRPLAADVVVGGESHSNLFVFH